MNSHTRTWSEVLAPYNLLKLTDWPIVLASDDLDIKLNLAFM